MPIRSFHLFRAGTHVPGTGAAAELTFTEHNIRTTAALYGLPGAKRAQIFLGHPRNVSGKPVKGGEVVHLQPDELGQNLYALADVSPDFIGLVRRGHFKRCSAGLVSTENGEWALDHVALLGAMPPAIKGLEPLNFSEWAEFSEDDSSRLKSLVNAFSDIPGMSRARCFEMAARLL